MAERDEFDFISFKKKLDSISRRLTSVIGELSAHTITALSWNLAAGSKSVYDFLVPQKVSDINPDVVLLQEVDNATVRSIASMCHLVSGRSYHSAGEKSVRVLYDSKVFSLLQTPKEDEIGTSPYVAAKLQHKETGMQITFTSFQSEFILESREKLATEICKIVSETANLVVAGVDIKCRTNFFDDILNDMQGIKIWNSETHQLILSDVQANHAFETLNIIPSTDPSFKEAYNNTHYQKSLKYVKPVLCSLSI